jgi:type II secretory pathway component PulF
MPLIVTPGFLTHRGEFYHQLGSLLTAGVGIIQALEMVRTSPPARSYRRPITKVTQQIEQGYTLVESLANLGDWLPAFDLALLDAGEKSGRLPDSCRLLAQYYSERAQLARRIIGALIYPLVIGHLAVLIFPPSNLARLMQGTQGMAELLVGKLTLLLPIYLGVFLIAYACQARHGEFWRSIMERCLRYVPSLGPARRALALARLSASLEALISAGVPILEAWRLSGQACGSPALRRSIDGWQPRLACGETPGQALQQTPRFPEMFRSLYLTGEQSGQLDDTLGRLHHHYQEEGSRRLQRFALWLPLLVYLVIMIAVAYFIVSFWLSYYQGIGEVLDF